MSWTTNSIHVVYGVFSEARVDDEFLEEPIHIGYILEELFSRREDAEVAIGLLEYKNEHGDNYSIREVELK